MARKPRARGTQQRPKTYREQVDELTATLGRLSSRGITLLRTADFTSPSWSRDVRTLGLAYLGTMQVWAGVVAPADYLERHEAILRCLRRVGDSLEALSGFVVDDHQLVGDPDGVSPVLRRLSAAQTGLTVTLVSMRRDLQAADVVIDETTLNA